MEEGVDVALCERSYFEGLLEDHVPWAVAFAYYPPCGIVFETIKLSHQQLWRQYKRALSINSQVNLNQAAALWRHGEVYKSRKRIFFVLQMTIFATQLVLSGRIYDFWEEPNKLRPLLFDDALDSWVKFDKVWRPVYDHLVNRFIDIRNAYRIRELEYLSASKEGRDPSEQNVQEKVLQIFHRPCPSLDPSSGNLDTTSSGTTKSDPYARKKASVGAEPPSLLQTMLPDYYRRGPSLTTQYIVMNGLNSLRRDLVVQYTRHPTFPNLIHFTRTPTLSPVDSVVASECHGMVVNELNGYQPVAWSHARYFKFDEEGPIRYDLWSPACTIVYHNPDGVLVELYYYGDQWNVATAQTIDGSEIFANSGRTISELFWEVWEASNVHLAQLDTSMSYSFWLLHSMARQRVIHATPTLLLEGALRWQGSEYFELPLDELAKQLPLATLKRLENLESQLAAPKSQKSGQSASQVHQCPFEDAQALPIGGLILQRGQDRQSRIYVPCAFMQRLDNIEKLDGDFLLQELEVLRLLVEQPGVESAWNYPPLPASLPAFYLVSTALKGLIATLEEYYPKLPTMNAQQVLEEVEKLGDVGHFVFQLKSERVVYENIPAFLKTANPRRLKKYLAQWWTKEHSKAPPRQNLQYSYK